MQVGIFKRVHIDIWVKVRVVLDQVLKELPDLSLLVSWYHYGQLVLVLEWYFIARLYSGREKCSQVLQLLLEFKIEFHAGRSDVQSESVAILVL